MIRMPDGMRESIATAAKANNRSMNAEIVSRLEESFKDDPRHQIRMGLIESAALLERIDELKQVIEKALKDPKGEKK